MIPPIPIAIIGCKFGAHLARDLKASPHSRFQIQAVCDLNGELAEALAAELGVEAVTDYRKLLADPTLSAIALLTGPGGRAQLLHEVLAAGKDIMTTKPFETDSVAARHVLIESQRLRRVIHLNSPAATIADDLLTILEWEKKYDLGRSAYFYGSVHANYHETADGSWYDDFVKCPAPPIFRLGIYLINDLQTLWGAVCAVRILETRLRTGRPTADNAVLSLEMENRAVGAITASFCVGDGDAYRNSLQLSYERGTIYRNMGPHRIGTHSDCELQLVQEILGVRRIVATAQVQSNAHKCNWNAFADAILRREPPTSGYIDRIVNGIETLNAMAREAGRNLTCS